MNPPLVMDPGTKLILYAVRNRDGRYLRAKGYNGYGETWVDGLQRARIYPRLGPARSQVTYFATHFPKFGVPELVELRVTEVVVLDEAVRVQKSLGRKAKAEVRREARHAQWQKEQAQKRFDEAQAELRRLNQVEEDAEKCRLERQT